MILFTRHPTTLDLVREAYRKGNPGEDQAVWVGNTQVRLVAGGEVVSMESHTPIYLDTVLEDLKIFTGRIPCPRTHVPYVLVRPRRPRRGGR